MMLYIPKIGDYLKILTDDKKLLNHFISFSKHLVKYKKHVEMMELNSSDNLVHCYNIEIFNLSDPELQLINTKPMIKNKLKNFLSELISLKFIQY